MNSLGMHILVELFECDRDKLDDVPGIEEAMIKAAEASGATVVNTTFHHFSPIGVSGVVVIQESHLAIHTWPEYGFAAVDLFTCGTTVDPWVAYEYLKKALNADYGSTIEMRRGEKRLMKESSLVSDSIVKPSQASVQSRNIWFTERDEDTAFSFRQKGKRLYFAKSSYQTVEVYDSYALGKVLALNGNAVITERDASVFHEMFAHVPGMFLREKSNVLVLGGGDGCLLAELVKYSEIDAIRLVERDSEVMKASKEHFKIISNAFEDDRLKVVNQDAFEFLKNSSGIRFDLILIDLDNSLLYNEFSIEKIKEKGAPDAIYVMPIVTKELNESSFDSNCKSFFQLFKNVEIYSALAGGEYSGRKYFLIGTDNSLIDFTSVDQKKVEEKLFLAELSFYNLEMHEGGFKKPNYLKKLLEEKLKCAEY